MQLETRAGRGLAALFQQPCEGLLSCPQPSTLLSIVTAACLRVLPPALYVSPPNYPQPRALTWLGSACTHQASERPMLWLSPEGSCDESFVPSVIVLKCCGAFKGRNLVGDDMNAFV